MSNWIAGAVKHPGRCTPMSKPGCTGAARALAERFKHGDIHEANTSASDPDNDNDIHQHNLKRKAEKEASN